MAPEAWNRGIIKMDSAALAQITDKLKEELSNRPSTVRAAIIGKTPAAFDLASIFMRLGAQEQLLGVYAEGGTGTRTAPLSEPRPLRQLADDVPDLALVASDDDKETLIVGAVPFLSSRTKILIGGFRHYQFRDPLFDQEIANAAIPSFANGYPYSLVHIYQCLKNAARLGLQGAVAEFGMFKGGTTLLMSRFISMLGKDWKVYGFDTFAGFPAPRSPLDMYSHRDCVYRDLSTLKRFFANRNVEIVPGDIADTVQILANTDIVAAFIDTDNYTPASRVLDIITDRILVHGAIIFDHFPGSDRFLYTLGERFAAKRLLDDSRYFNLHGTGVFLRLK